MSKVTNIKHYRKPVSKDQIKPYSDAAKIIKRDFGRAGVSALGETPEVYRVTGIENVKTYRTYCIVINGHHLHSKRMCDINKLPADDGNATAATYIDYLFDKEFGLWGFNIANLLGEAFFVAATLKSSVALALDAGYSVYELHGWNLTLGYQPFLEAITELEAKIN